MPSDLPKAGKSGCYSVRLVTAVWVPGREKPLAGYTVLS